MSTFNWPLSWRDYALYGSFNPWTMCENEKEYIDNFKRLNKIYFCAVIWDHPYLYCNRPRGYVHGYQECAMFRVTERMMLRDIIDNVALRAESSDRLQKIREWYHEKWPDRLITLHDGTLYPHSYTWLCEETEEYYKDVDESYEVYVDDRLKTWCKSAMEDRAFRCHYSGSYYSFCSYSPVGVEGNIYCSEAECLYFWDGDFHLEPEPEEDDGLMAYHAGARPWIKNPPKGLVFGVELEMYSKDRFNVAELARDVGFLAEQDSSLDDECGVEIIAPPGTFAEHMDETGNWMKFLDSVQGKAIAWDAGTGYGMHVSVNRAALTPFHVGKLLVFIHCNRAFCERIAGRRQTNYTVYNDWTRIPLAKRAATGHCDAASLCNRHRIEVRIFRATLKKTSFLKNIEFVAAAVEFTRQASALLLTDSHFIEWLKMNKKQYPNLSLFLGLKKQHVPANR